MRERKDDKEQNSRNSLAVQWVGLHVFTAQGPASNSGGVVIQWRNSDKNRMTGKT